MHKQNKLKKNLLEKLFYMIFFYYEHIYTKEHQWLSLNNIQNKASYDEYINDVSKTNEDKINNLLM